jgi:hypothetical protein
MAWFEDTVYLYHGFALHAGQRPFVDLIFVHPPTIEALLALLFKVFSVSYRTSEIVTAFMTVSCGLLLFDFCRRLIGVPAAMVAVVLYSLSGLLARYHVFEREIFTMTLGMCAVWMLTMRLTSWWRYLLVGIACGLAFAVKFSGLFIFAAVVIYLMAGVKDRRSCLFVLAGFAAAGIGIWAYYLIRFGGPAFDQLIVFHFVKSTSDPLWNRFHDIYIKDLNYLWIVGSGGLLLGLMHPNRRVCFVFAVLWAEITIFFLFLSKTMWSHNMIDLLPALATGGALTFDAVRAMAVKRKANKRIVAAVVASMAFFIACGALDLRPVIRSWGYYPRAAVEDVVRFIRSNTDPVLPIHGPYYLACETQRLKIIDYEELTGPYRWMLKAIKAGGYNGLRNAGKFDSWLDMVKQTSGEWRSELHNAIVERRISAGVWDALYPEWYLIYEMDDVLEQEAMVFERSGYAVRYDKKPYIVWVKQ